MANTWRYLRVSGDPKAAKVDRDDYDRVAQRGWTLMTTATGPLAVSSVRSGGLLSLHRVVLGLGPADPRRIVHRNGDKLDCRKANLCFYERKHPPLPPVVSEEARPDGPAIRIGGHRPRRHGAPSVVRWARVDAEDMERLSQHVWTAMGRRDGRVIAVRRERLPDGRYRQIQMHREILGIGPEEPRMVDHINHDALDNRRANLRLVTNSENQRNREYQGNGYYYEGNKGYVLPWVVPVRFATEEEAAAFASEHIAHRRKDRVLV